MRYRKLDENGDYSFGRGQADFWRDVPDAPAQAIRTRLWLFQGEWWLNTLSGTPWDTRVLGKYTGDSRDPVVRLRALDTEGVRSILSYTSNLNRDTREYVVFMTVDTDYGRVTLQEPL